MLGMNFGRLAAGSALVLYAGAAMAHHEGRSAVMAETVVFAGILVAVALVAWERRPR